MLRLRAQLVVALATFGCADVPPGTAISPAEGYTPSALTMFTSEGKVSNSPLTFDGDHTIEGAPGLSVADGTVSLSSYRGSSLPLPFGVLRFTSEIADQGLFAVAAGAMQGNAGVTDPVMAIGYNSLPRGSKWMAGEHSLGLFFEGHWHDGTNEVMESYLQYQSADGATELRPLFFMFDRKTDRLVNAAIRGNPLNILDDEGHPAMEIGPGVTNMFSRYTYLKDPDANIVGDGNVYVKAGVGDANGSLYLGAGGSGSVFLEVGSANPVRICVNGCDTTVGGTLTVTGPVQTGGAGGPKWISGAGDPDGHVVCGVGCLYSRTDGGPGTTLYVKEAGTGAFGWVAK